MVLNLFVIRPKGLNVGNDAIYIGLRAFIEREFDEMPNLINLPATNRYDSYPEAGLTASTIHKINQFGHGVIVGGGNLYENGELDVDINALNKLSPPLMLYSLSRGRIYNNQDKLVDRTDVMSDKVIVELNKNAYLSLVRDAMTQNYLNDIGIKNSVLAGCPTLFLNKTSNEENCRAVRNSRVAFICIRNPELMNISLRRQAGIRTDIEKIFSLLLSSGYEKVNLLCHDIRDISFASSFENIPYIYKSDPHEYLELIKSAGLIVSFRIHASLPALSYGTPFINISYDERGLGLMNIVGLNSWNISLVEDSPLIDAVSERLGNLSELDRCIKIVSPVWSELYKIQSSSFQKFYRKMKDYEYSTKSNDFSKRQ